MNNELIKAFIIAVLAAPAVYIFLVVLMSLDVILDL